MSTENVKCLAQIWLRSQAPCYEGRAALMRLHAVAQSLVNGFELSPATALPLLLSEFNPRCEPGWAESELRAAVEFAQRKPVNHPRGWLIKKETKKLVTVADLAAGDEKTVFRVMAIMTGVRYGLDETRGEVGLMFAARVSDSLGAPQFLDAEVAALVIAAYKVGDVARLEGKPCWAALENGRLLFDIPCLI